MPVRPSTREEEFFAREEAEKKRKLAQQRADQMAREERDALRDMHFMRCPKCGMKLTEISFRGVLVDKCYSCNGLWLDDGEIEKLAGEDGVVSRMLGFLSRN